MCQIGKRIPTQRVDVRRALMYLGCALENRQVTGPHLALEIGFSVLVAHLPDLVETAELQGFVLVDRRTDVLAIVTVFHLLQVTFKSCFLTLRVD